MRAPSKASNSNCSPQKIGNIRRRFPSITLRIPSLTLTLKLFLPLGHNGLKSMSKRLKGRLPV